jgi:hypothetical protein
VADLDPVQADDSLQQLVHPQPYALLQ